MNDESFTSCSLVYKLAPEADTVETCSKRLADYKGIESKGIRATKTLQRDYELAEVEIYFFTAEENINEMEYSGYEIMQRIKTETGDLTIKCEVDDYEPIKTETGDLTIKCEVDDYEPPKENTTQNNPAEIALVSPKKEKDIISTAPLVRDRLQFEDDYKPLQPKAPNKNTDHQNLDFTNLKRIENDMSTEEPCLNKRKCTAESAENSEIYDLGTATGDLVLKFEEDDYELLQPKAPNKNTDRQNLDFTNLKRIENDMSTEEPCQNKRKCTAESAENNEIYDLGTATGDLVLKFEEDDYELEEKHKELKRELKRKRNCERQRAYYHRQKGLKKHEERKKKKKVPKTNAERQRAFRQRKAQKSYVDL